MNRSLIFLMSSAVGTLPHNPKNAVTQALRRIEVEAANGIQTQIVKQLNGRNSPQTLREWRASNDPTHWNFWRREPRVYQSDLAALLAPTRVRLPQLLDLSSGKEGEASVTLTLEDVEGRTGHSLQLADYATIAEHWGYAQAVLSRSGYLNHAWVSRYFVRRYASSKPVDYALIKDKSAWDAPLIRDNWPLELQEGLQHLWANSERMYQTLEQSLQIPCHLDFWPNNVILDKADELVLIDLGFFGYGAVGEDIGNFVPDAIFDGFMPPELFADIEALMVDSYINGWRASGVMLNDRQLRKNIHASAVKYVWLGPLLLENAQKESQQAYGGTTLEDANEQYRARGVGLMNLCKWAAQSVVG